MDISASSRKRHSDDDNHQEEGNDTECCVCYEAYDSKKHIPRLLVGCGHSLCAQCLVTANLDKCPVCQSAVVGGIDKQPVNYALKSIAEAAAARRHATAASSASVAALQPERVCEGETWSASLTPARCDKPRLLRCHKCDRGFCREHSSEREGHFLCVECARTCASQRFAAVEARVKDALAAAPGVDYNAKIAEHHKSTLLAITLVGDQLKAAVDRRVAQLLDAASEKHLPHAKLVGDECEAVESAARALRARADATRREHLPRLLVNPIALDTVSAELEQILQEHAKHTQNVADAVSNCCAHGFVCDCTTISDALGKFGAFVDTRASAASAAASSSSLVKLYSFAIRDGVFAMGFGMDDSLFLVTPFSHGVDKFVCSKSDARVAPRTQRWHMPDADELLLCVTRRRVVCILRGVDMYILDAHDGSVLHKYAPLRYKAKCVCVLHNIIYLVDETRMLCSAAMTMEESHVNPLLRVDGCERIVGVGEYLFIQAGHYISLLKNNVFRGFDPKDVIHNMRLLGADAGNTVALVAQAPTHNAPWLAYTGERVLAHNGERIVPHVTAKVFDADVGTIKEMHCLNNVVVLSRSSHANAEILLLNSGSASSASGRR